MTTLSCCMYTYFSLCLQHCSSEGPEGPSGFLERLCFEMKKGYKETMLQLLLSPIHIFVSDNCQVWKMIPNACLKQSLTKLRIEFKKINVILLS